MRKLEKLRARKTLSVNTQNYEKLCALQRKLEQILERNVSLDETLNIVLTVKSLDSQLEEMMLES